MDKKLTDIFSELCNLWEHQKDAIKKSYEYIKDFNSKNGTKNSCLIQIPTGSGKSGIITVLSRCVPQEGAVLILTPRFRLRKQLFEDISYYFFENIEFDRSLSGLEINDNIIEVTHSDSNSLLQDIKGKIYIMTYKC